MKSAAIMPSLFLSHGSPMIALEPREAGAFMQRLGPALMQTFGKPSAILVASAHSTAPLPTLLAAPQHHAVHDFGGFDPQLYRMRYDAPGAPALAERAAGLLRASGIDVRIAQAGGLDHGILTPLRYLFPDADIPILPLAWPPHASPAELHAIGAALAPLTREGVLVIGSGSITHNLRRVFAGGLQTPADRPVTPESRAFREWFAERIATPDWAALFDYRAQAPHASLMHPTDEHLLPFYIAAGAASISGSSHADGIRVHQSETHGDLGMDAYAFGPQAARLATL